MESKNIVQRIRQLMDEEPEMTEYLTPIEKQIVTLLTEMSPQADGGQKPPSAKGFKSGAG